jgi:ABC-2 type transport system permease protein
MSVLMWNSLLAAIASVITDPNNSGKSSLMLLPVLFIVITLVISPQNKLAVFLSWFPLTSATAMPMRWVVGNVDLWQLAGSFILLTATFYLLRKLAAKIFRVSILISGKEPTWGEIINHAKEA